MRSGEKGEARTKRLAWVKVAELESRRRRRRSWWVVTGAGGGLLLLIGGGDRTLWPRQPRNMCTKYKPFCVDPFVFVTW